MFSGLNLCTELFKKKTTKVDVANITISEAFNILSKEGIFLDRNASPYQLADVQEELINWLLNLPKGKALVVGARGIGKTEIATIFDSALTIARNPFHTELIVCKNYRRAKLLLEQIKKCLEVWGIKVTERAGSELWTEVNNTKAPTLSIKSLESRDFKGQHIRRTKLEDLLDESAMYSTAAQELAHNRAVQVEAFSEKVLMIGNYVHEDDVVSKWSKDINVKKIELWIDNPKVAKLVAKSQITKESYLSTATMRYWGINFEGVFYPDEEAIFHTIEYANSNQSISQVYMAIDTANSANNDFTAVAIGGINTNGQLVAYLNGWQQPYYELVNEISKLANNSRVRRIYYESQDNNPHLKSLLSELGHKAYWFRSSENKIKRILSLKPLINSGSILLEKSTPPHAEKLLKEWHPTTKGHDDIPDVLHMLKKVINGEVEAVG